MKFMAATIVIVTEEDAATIQAEITARLDGMMPRARASVLYLNAMKLVPAPQVQMIEIKSAQDLAGLLQKSGN